MSDIQKYFEHRAANRSDINEHMPRLRELAQECIHVTEFGTRSGNSTIAFLAGLEASAGLLVSYDINPHGVADVPPVCRWQFNQADTSKLPEIVLTDMLFIDTLHDCDQVEAELKHANRAARYLVFHDTVLFGSKNELKDGPGIMHAILCFMAKNWHWRVWEHHANNCGLLVLRRAE